MSLTRIFSLGLLTLLFGTAVSAPAGEALIQPGPGDATVEQLLARVDTRLGELAQTPDLSDEQRTRLSELYQSAKRFLVTAQAHAKNRADFQRLPDTAPKRLQELKTQIEQAEQERQRAAEIPIDPQASVAALEQQLIQQQTDLAALKGRQDQLRHDKEMTGKRPLQAKDQLTEAKRRIEEIEQSLAQPDPPDLHPLVAEAQRLLLRARLMARKAETQMLDQEFAVNDLRLSLVSAELDLVDRQAASAAEKVRRLQETLATRRQQEAEATKREAEQALREAAGKHPAIQALTQENVDWGRRLTEAVEGRAKTIQHRETLKQQARQIEADFHSAQQKLKVAGLSDALGQVLRDQRLKLPDQRQYRKRARQREAAIGAIGLAKIDVEEQLARLQLPDRELERLANMAAPGMPPSALPQSVRSELKRLLDDQKKLLEDLDAALAGYLRELVELDYEEQQLLVAAGDYGGFLDERLLWIRSARPMGTATLRDLVPSLAWMFSPTHWLETILLLGRELAHGPFLTLLVGLVVGMLWHRRTRFFELEEQATRGTRKVSTDSFGLTLKATAMALLLALPPAILLAYLGWELQTAPDAGEFPRAVGAALSGSATALLILLGLIQLIRSGGICETHFDWNPQVLKLLRHQLPWFTAFIVPTLFLTMMIGAQQEVSRLNSLGRLISILALGILTVLIYRLFWSRNGLVRLTLQRDPNSWTARLRYLWGGAALTLPLIAAGLSAGGYHYSAAQIVEALRESARLLVGLYLLRALALRWFLVHRQRLAWVQALERRQALRETEMPETTTPQGTEMLHPEVPQRTQIDLTKVDEQTRSLINTLMGWSIVVGLYLIWAEFLPAFRVLDNTALWHYTAIVQGQEKIEAFTLADLGLILVIGILIAAAARNLPGILEVVLLQRLPITTGSRYAIKTIVQYLIVGAGLVYSFQTLGASWSQVQWLVAALGVGLGFGMQEIFGNFISGLIILFERPIRVGDTITVGDVTGVVTRVRIRATTIRDWDRKELVVPNKSFITERVINWTLSDPVTRLVIRIGVAYGTDTNRVRDLVMDLVRKNPLVLSEPAPTLYFEQFGDSSLNLVLRVYVHELEHRLPVTHELHTAINEAFEREGIRIPYPQRDIHVFQEAPSAT